MHNLVNKRRSSKKEKVIKGSSHIKLDKVNYLKKSHPFKNKLELQKCQSQPIEVKKSIQFVKDHCGMDEKT
jgi:hypothetical protein